MAYHQRQNCFQMIHFYFRLHDVDTSANELNNDLYQINKWDFQWKISFNPDQSKQAQEISLVEKLRKLVILRSDLNSIVLQSPHQKNLGIISLCSIMF